MLTPSLTSVGYAHHFAEYAYSGMDVALLLLFEIGFERNPAKHSLRYIKLARANHSSRVALMDDSATRKRY